MPETYVGTSGAAGSAGIWTIIVTIAGVDVTARIVGDIRIDAEEDSARVADLTIAPASTSFAVAAWVGKSITIDIAAMHTGSPTSVERLFTGIIDTPVLDLAGRRIGLRCTDDLQGVVEAMDAAAIDAAIPDGYYSPAIFDPAARGWSRAQDRLSTVPASLDLTPAGALRLTAWEPSFAPDLAFTAAHLLDGSLSVSIAGAHDLTNSVAIDFGYRFPRVKAETYAVGYDYVNAGTISAFASALSWFLQRSAVESAIKSAGAKIVAISYTPLPSSGVGSWIPSPYDAELCMGFTATVTFDYGQTIEERHAITVYAPNSIAAVGARSARRRGRGAGGGTSSRYGVHAPDADHGRDPRADPRQPDRRLGPDARRAGHGSQCGLRHPVAGQPRIQARRHRCRRPDPVHVLRNGVVGGELAHRRDVEQGALSPRRGLSEQGINLGLGRHITGEVGHQQVVVAPQQSLHQGLVALAVAE